MGYGPSNTVWDMGYGRVWPIWQGTDSVDTRKYGLREFMGYHRYGLRQRRLYSDFCVEFESKELKYGWLLATKPTTFTIEQ